MVSRLTADTTSRDISNNRSALPWLLHADTKRIGAPFRLLTSYVGPQIQGHRPPPILGRQAVWTDGVFIVATEHGYSSTCDPSTWPSHSVQDLLELYMTRYTEDTATRRHQGHSFLSPPLGKHQRALAVRSFRSCAPQAHRRSSASFNFRLGKLSNFIGDFSRRCFWVLSARPTRLVKEYTPVTRWKLRRKVCLWSLSSLSDFVARRSRPTIVVQGLVSTKSADA